jgi:hypothetical protein
MSHYEFLNSSCSLNDLFYKSSTSLVENICRTLGHSDCADDMIFKFLDKSHAKIRPGKDSDAPKRGRSSFILFSNEVREEVRAKNASATTVEISKIIGTMWQALSQKKKMRFVTLAEKDRERYQEEKVAYENSLVHSNSEII